MFQRISLLLLSVSVAGNAAALQSVSAVPQAASSTTQPILAFGLSDGTPVKLRLNRNVSSATDKVGDPVEFEVLEEVKVADVIVIPRGSVASGAVSGLEPKGRMGRAAKLNVEINSVRLKDGEKAPLREVPDTKDDGASKTTSLAANVVLLPASSLSSLRHGKDVLLPKGTEITVFVAGNLLLEKAKFEMEEGATSRQTIISITSSPPGATIQVDGSIIGNTPSSIDVVGGDHHVTVFKTGYKPWERTLTVSGGTLNLNAELAKEK